MTCRIEIENIAGIRSGGAKLREGLNTLQASNWQGKTSFLSAIQTAMGTQSALTEGMEAGHVEFEIADTTYSIELTRSDGQVTRTGGRYLSDELDLAYAELFAFLDESNPIREAVRNGGDLEAPLTRPLDLEDLETKIRELQQERDTLESELEDAEQASQKLPTLQEAVTSLQGELEELRAEREAKLDGIEPGDATELRDELSDKRAARNRVQNRLETLDTQVENIEESIEEKRAELDGLEVEDGPELADELEEKRADLETVNSKIDLLQAVYSANRRVMDEGMPEVFAEVDHGIMDDEINCWTCGNRTTSDSLRERLSALQDTLSTYRSRGEELQSEIELIERQRETVREQERKKVDLEESIADLEVRLSDKLTALEEAQTRLEELESSIESIQGDVTAATDAYTDLESEIKYKEAELEDRTAELERAEALTERGESIRSQIESVNDEIEALRTKKERLKQSVGQEFERAMEDVLEVFDPGFERAWLDDYELRIAREGRWVSVDALSEGEVELLGILVAIAGYEAFDVRERVPIVLLDGLGALAGHNLQELAEYLEERTEYLVITAYPESGEFDGHTISPTDWSVVSNEVRPTA